MSRIMLAVGAVPLAVFSLPAFAQDAPDPANPAPSILVVGQRERDSSLEARGLSVSLGDEQFAGVNARNVEDLMKYAPDFFVRTRFAGDSNGVPGFRGTHSTQSARTLVMVDGFTVSNFLGNSFAYSPKWGVVGPGEVEQFDIVYGPYSARYAGNSMGGVVNITTRSPEATEAFATVQGMAQPYDQYGTHDTYRGYSAEAGFGLRQKDGPWSLRLSGRHFRNTGHPQMFYGLAANAGAGPATPVTGALVDAGQAIGGAPGTPASPIFAGQSPARITQDQAKLRIGYDGDAQGVAGLSGELLVAYWHNLDSQTAPDCYLRDGAGNTVCEGAVSFAGRPYTASGAIWSRTVRDELLAGLKVAADLSNAVSVQANVSTYRILRSDAFTSQGWATGASDGAGRLSRQGPTDWWTGELAATAQLGAVELAGGGSANIYRTDLVNYALPQWRSSAGRAFSSRTFGKTRNLAAWAELRVPLGPVTLTLGARYEDWRAFDGGLSREQGAAGQPVIGRYASRHADGFQPKASLDWAVAADTHVQLSLARATRFPTVGELFQGELNGDGTFNPASFDPNLRPERSSDANLLVAHDFGPVKLTASAFWQRVKDTIFSFYRFTPAGVSTSSFTNIDVTRQYGFELIAQAHDVMIAGLDVDANAAWIDSQTVRNDAAPAAQGVQFPRIPRWRLNGNLRYRVAPPVLLSVGARYASRPNTDLFGLQRGRTYGYTSELFALDARVSWDVSQQLRVSAGVDNITNNRAWVYHPYPQRSFLLEAGWKL